MRSFTRKLYDFTFYTVDLLIVQFMNLAKKQLQSSLLNQQNPQTENEKSEQFSW